MRQVAIQGRSLSRGTERTRLVDLRESSYRASARISATRACRKEHPMLDVIMLALGLGFFALSVGYTIACDRL
jgi:hypothetical protein